jgi:type II secretory pathway component PulC
MLIIDEQKTRGLLIALTLIVYFSILYCIYDFFIDTRAIKLEYASFQEHRLNNDPMTELYTPGLLKQWKLFGSADPSIGYSQKNLTVVGIFMDNDPKLRAAVISEKDATPQLYYINDDLPGHAVIKAIEVDRVTIQAGAHTEILYYNSDALKNTSSKSTLTNTSNPIMDPKTIQKASPYGGNRQYLEEIRQKQLRETKQ